MYGFIYLTTNNKNGKKYVGMCKYTHEKEYIGSGKLLKQAIKKYGKDSFTRVTLEDCPTFKYMCEAEKKWIDKLQAVESKDYYNISYGGFGGCSKSIKDYWSMYTLEERKHMRNWNRPDISGSKNPMYGKKHTEETKKKIGSKSINRNWGRKTPVKGANNPNAKTIKVVFDNGNTVRFECIKDFCDEYKYNYSTMKSLYKNGNHSKRYGLKIEKC
jgi:group I intron endonuclease